MGPRIRIHTKKMSWIRNTHWCLEYLLAENSRIRIRIHESDVWIRGSGSTPKKFHGSATHTLVPGVLAAGQEDGQALLLGQNGLQLPLPGSERLVCEPSVRQLGQNRLSQVHSHCF
jgi:hypothetical protein